MLSVVLLVILFIYPSFSLYCDTPFDCTNFKSINLSNEDLYARGYSSASVNGSITIQSGCVYCSGAYSCLTESIFSDKLISYTALYGSGSAYNVSSILTANELNCYASISCLKSNIQSASRSYCSGDQSCGLSSINGVDDIYGYGAYSFQNSTIDSVNTSGTMNVNFYGFQSAFGTLVRCQAGHTCTINCYGDSCKYILQPHCIANSVCFMHSSPDIMQNESLNNVLLYDSMTLSLNNDIKCNLMNSITYDNYREYYNGSDLVVDGDNVPFICCRGFQSCYKTSKIELNATSGNAVICSGRSSCQDIIIKNYYGDVFCEGYYACDGAKIYSNHNIYCLGHSALYDATIRAAGNVFCGGFLSCQNANISSTGDGRNLTIYFLGYDSMKSANIYCMKNDFCRVIQASDTTSSLTVATVHCFGECVVQCPTNYNCPNIITSNPTTSPPTILTINPTFRPTIYPTITTINPTITPTIISTFHPTTNPTFHPTIYPTKITTVYPTTIPTISAALNTIATIYPTQTTTLDLFIEMNVSIASSQNISVLSVIDTVNKTISEYLKTLPVEYLFVLEYDTIQPAANGTTIVEIEINVYNIDRVDVETKEIEQLLETALKSNYQENAELTSMKITDYRDIKQQVAAKRSFYERIIMYTAILCAVIIVLSYIDSRLIRKNDFFKIGALTIATLHFLDVVSDVFLSATIHFHQQLLSSTSLFILFILSIVFIVFPALFSMYQLHKEINSTWYKMENEELNLWCSKHQTKLYALSLLLGSSFASVYLSTSHLFDLDAFCLPLNQLNVQSFQNQRIVSIVFLENIPQIAIQIAYIQLTEPEKLGDPTVYVSMIFSIISIIAVMSGVVQQNRLTNQQQFTEIQFDAKNNDIMKSKTQCQRKVKQLQRKLGEVLEIRYNLIEMKKPLPISGGLRIISNIFITNNRSIERDLGTMMRDASKSGELSEIIKSCWKLNGAPNINNIQCKTMQSFNDKQNIFRRIRQSVVRYNYEQNAVEIMEQSQSSPNQSNDTNLD